MSELKRPTIGLALSGASSRATYYIGFLEVMAENNIPIDYICLELWVAYRHGLCLRYDAAT